MGKLLKLNKVTFEKDGYSFIKIGKEADLDVLNTEDFRNSKYKKIDAIWGTLGWADDRKLSAKGDIQFSIEGNTEHRGVTKEIASLLQAQNVEVKTPESIKERFVDLSKVQFGNLPKSIQSEEQIQLRFDLFLDKDEGALVYLQANPKSNFNSKDAEVHLITPESTDSTMSQDRYRLTYIFTYTFGKQLEYKDEKVLLKDLANDSKDLLQYALKVLTFPRTESDFKQYVKKASKGLNQMAVGTAHKGLHKLGVKKYQLYNYKVIGNEGEFQSYTNHPIDTTKKTLLLIHGTFSSVDGSFGELCKVANRDRLSLFTALIKSKKFDQIIAFDHPTASHGVEDNVKWLLESLPPNRFEQPVQVMTTSRGALVAEYLTASSSAFGKFKINKVLMFAPAHGSDLLKITKGLDRVLSLMGKTSSKTVWGYILAVAQFSIKAIRTQPGLDVMMPGSDRLKSILKLDPVETVYFRAMVGDYDGVLIQRRFRRFMANGLDKLLWLAFKSENDWVIGCPEQRKQLHGSNAKYLSNYEYKCIHGKQFDPTHPKQGGKKADVRDVISSYFD